MIDSEEAAHARADAAGSRLTDVDPPYYRANGSFPLSMAIVDRVFLLDGLEFATDKPWAGMATCEANDPLVDDARSFDESAGPENP